jgi:hypothetical protein
MMMMVMMMVMNDDDFIDDESVHCGDGSITSYNTKSVSLASFGFIVLLNDCDGDRL